MFEELLIDKSDIQILWDKNHQYCWSDIQQTYIIYRSSEWKNCWLWEILENDTGQEIECSESFPSARQAQKDVEQYLFKNNGWLPTDSKLYRPSSTYVLHSKKHYSPEFYSSICLKRNNLSISGKEKHKWYALQSNSFENSSNYTPLKFKYFKSRSLAVDNMFETVAKNLDILYHTGNYQEAKEHIYQHQFLHKWHWWVFFVRPEIDLQTVFSG